jgi:hypothetical protein
MRPVYLFRGQYPRNLREDGRSETWSFENLENLPQREEWRRSGSVLLGYIPQVAHTYALIEGYAYIIWFYPVGWLICTVIGIKVI